MAGKTERSRQAALDAARAIEGVGLGVRTFLRSETGADLLIVTPGGATLSVDIAETSRADPSRLAALIDTRGTGAGIFMLVADEVPALARRMLTRAGWAWLDRRGHLRLDAPGVLIDTEVEPTVAVPSRSRDPIRGVSGISYAAALLLTPDKPPSIREVARRSRLSASTVSDASIALRQAALVSGDGHPLLPDLFWALADSWRPERMSIAARPARLPDRATRDLGVLGDTVEEGWAVSGDLGALAWKAPIATAGTPPPDFYVPSKLIFSDAIRRYGRAASADQAACTVALAPTPLVCAPRYAIATSEAEAEWYFTHPLFVALDLAVDQARGVEILADFTPDESRGFTRVW